MKIRKLIVAGVFAALPAAAIAADASAPTKLSISVGGSGLWLLANISYAGMRAQNSPSAGWRIVAFIFGFPGTLISYLAVKEGGERAYGVDLPRRLPDT